MRVLTCEFWIKTRNSEMQHFGVDHSGWVQGAVAACFDVKGRGFAMVTHTKRTAWTDETEGKNTGRGQRRVFQL